MTPTSARLTFPIHRRGLSISFLLPSSSNLEPSAFFADEKRNLLRTCKDSLRHIFSISLPCLRWKPTSSPSLSFFCVFSARLPNTQASTIALPTMLRSRQATFRAVKALQQARAFTSTTKPIAVAAQKKVPTGQRNQATASAAP